MRIVCSHDEASLLRIWCHKYGKCKQCVLGGICDLKKPSGDLSRFLYTDPKVALLITKDDAQVIKGGGKKNANGGEAFTKTYSITFTYDYNGRVYAKNGTDITDLSRDDGSSTIV